jgi:uroporphyrin-3 C-methyltransferase
MSTEIQPDVTEKPEGNDKAHVTGKQQGLRNYIAPLLIAAIAAVVIAAWQWYEASSQIKDLQKEFERRLVEVDSSIERRLVEVDSSNKELRSISDKVREKREETEARLKLLETNLTESISRQETLEGLYQDLAPGRDEVIMEEVEQLLLIANQQLQLANNVKAALIAMQEANVRLQRINHPQLSPLRDVLAKDMDLLKAVPMVDTMGISLRLESLAEAVDKLPLVMEIRPPENINAPHKPQTWGGKWQDFLLEIWNDIKQLIRIQHVGEQDIPPPSHSYFLRENLKLRLLSAHNALLAHDAVSFKANLKISIEWINKYYDNKSKPTISMLATLHQLNDNEIGIELPNVSASYDAVRKYRITAKKKTKEAPINSNAIKQKRILEKAEADEDARLLAEAAAKAKAGSKAKAGEEVEIEMEVDMETEAEVGEEK